MEAYFHSLLAGPRRGVWPGLQRAGLWVLSRPYGWVVQGRNWLFDRGWKRSGAVGVPVVSVGNLTVGGTGKTPCVEHVARFFRRHNKRVAILSRGYRGRNGVNDEAMVLAWNLPGVPHLQGSDRLALAQIAVQELGAEVLVLDDGFQHRRLRRDLDIVLIDATAPWGHGHLLPRGLLREPPSGLKRAHLAMLTHCDQAAPGAIRAICERIDQLAPGLSVIETAHKPGQWVCWKDDGETGQGEKGRRGEGEKGRTGEFSLFSPSPFLPLSHSSSLLHPPSLHDRPWAAFCGIGNPETFRETLRKLGGKLCAWRTFPDHHDYDRATLEDLRDWAEKQPWDCAIVTTQKDLVKLRVQRLGERELWALPIRLHIMAQGRVLEDKLFALLSGGRVSRVFTPAC